MKGDVLVADYRFQSEGMTSARQVAFKKQGDGFVEGFGEVFTDSNGVQFKSVDSLQFNSNMPLVEVPCR